MAQYLITYSKQINENNLFGFKIYDQKQANLYMHCVDALVQENISWNFDEYQLPYDNEDFVINKITSSEMKTLCKLFDLDYLNESSVVGTFPDAINDSYEYNLIDDEEDDIEDIDDDF